jgi:hypothetical protein
MNSQSVSDDTMPLANTANAMRPQGILLPFSGTAVASRSRGYRARDHVIDVAPDPVFSRLDRPHHGMAGVLKVFGGVFVLRRIAAAYVSAGHAHAQVNPGVTKLDALFADMCARARDLNLIQVLAFLCHC